MPKYRRRMRGLPVPLREATAAVQERTALRETVTTAITEAPPGGALVDIQIIRAGWNTSGSRYYPADVLARDIPKVYPAGTHMHWDHPTVTEEAERPERSLTTLAAVFADTPYTLDGGKTMRVKARVFGPYQEFVREAWADIGVSINGEGTGQFGEAEGRKGLIIDALTLGESVDFVTKPGAGGRILSLLESARTLATREARSVGVWLESRLHLALTEYADDMYGYGRLTREERITLSSAIGDGLKAWTARVEADAPQLFERDIYDEPGERTTDTEESTRTREATTEEVRRALQAAVRAAYATDETFVWVRDYDADRGLVWYEVSDSGDMGSRLWQEAYTVADGTATLAGERTQAVARVVYDPVPSPQGETVIESTTPVPVETPGTDDATPTPAEQPDSTDPAPGNQPADTVEEGDMPDEPNTEAQARELEEARKLAEAAQAERDAARARLAEAERETARLKATEAARPIAVQMVTQADIPAAARVRVLDEALRSVPLTEDLKLDAATFKARVDEALQKESAYLASIAEESGAGQVRGLGVSDSAAAGVSTGGQASSGRVDNSQIHADLVETYKRRGMSEEAARYAATGRP